MDFRKFTPYILQGMIAGVLIGLLFNFFVDTRTAPQARVVEIKQAAPAPLQDDRDRRAPIVSFARAVQHAAPAVVNIFTSKTITQRNHPLLDDPLFRRFFGDREFGSRQRTETSLGSGVIASSDGFVLTNNHVIDGADEIQVLLRDGRKAQARVVGTDPETDLAVLKIDVGDVPSITIGDSEQLLVGDVVLAIGNPFGVGQTVTLGIVSATGRSRLGISTFENFIQTDAAINPGNSGGALINTAGELVGINTAIFSRSGGSQGIGFAIPISLAKTVMTQIIESGHTIRGWLGVEIQDINEDLAESFDLPDTAGALVAGVLRGGPADKAGIRPGDVILGVGGVSIRNVSEALNAISAKKPGETIPIEIRRGGKTLTINTRIGERPPPARR